MTNSVTKMDSRVVEDAAVAADEATWIHKKKNSQKKKDELTVLVEEEELRLVSLVDI